MYKVLCDGYILHDDRLDSLRLTSANLTLELGKTGLFEFSISPYHQRFDMIVPMLSMIEVQRNGEVIFNGRVLNIKYGFYGEKQVSCEGELAFLLDSMIEPHTYSNNFVGYLPYILEKHNAQVESTKQFKAGVVTVGDFYPFYVVENLEYKSALDTLNSKMVAQSGGYLQVRYEDGERYLDLLSYSADISNVSSQTIEIGKNLLDISRETNSENVFSCIVPLGAKQENSELRIDIKNVNSGLPYIVNEKAVSLYGRIYRQVIFDNITYPQTLKETAEAYLEEHFAGENTIEITAADLSGLDVSIDSFKVGQRVNVTNQWHFTESQLFLIKKTAIDLVNPTGNKIFIGEVKKGITDTIAEIVSSREDSTAVQPYVIESGTTGIWSWKKFSDGTCEFFGKVPVTGADVSTAFGNWYRGANLYDSNAYSYPVQMTEAPALEMTFQTRNGLAALLWPFSADAETAQTYLPQCYLIRPTTATGISGNINIIGKGKL